MDNKQQLEVTTKPIILGNCKLCGMTSQVYPNTELCEECQPDEILPDAKPQVSMDDLFAMVGDEPLLPVNDEPRIPPPHIQEMIRKSGSPGQLQKLDEQLAAADLPEKRQATKDSTEWLLEVARMPDRKARATQADAIRFLAGRLTRGMGKRPEIVTYENARKLYWAFYREIIRIESGINTPTVDGNMAKFMKNYVHWLIGSPAGEYDPNKSLYIWGDLGVGKSTMAMAGHYLMAYYRHRFQWDIRYFKAISMDELFLNTYTTQSLEGIGKLSSDAWLLDELCEQHVKYKHYGQEFYILVDVLRARHNLWKREGLNTIITANIQPKNLQEVFADERLYARLGQQYETILIEGDNKRKPKYRLVS